MQSVKLITKTACCQKTLWHAPLIQSNLKMRLQSFLCQFKQFFG